VVAAIFKKKFEAVAEVLAFVYRLNKRQNLKASI